MDSWPPRPDDAPVITLDPAIWERSPAPRAGGWAATIPASPRYTLDVVLHELLHVDVNYLRGGAGRGHSSHDNLVWCEAVEVAASKLRGTMLELRLSRHGRRSASGQTAACSDGPPEGCLPMGRSLTVPTLTPRAQLLRGSRDTLLIPRNHNQPRSEDRQGRHFCALSKLGEVKDGPAAHA